MDIPPLPGIGVTTSVSAFPAARALHRAALRFDVIVVDEPGPDAGRPASAPRDRSAA